MLGRLHLITDSRPGADPVAQVRSALTVATPELVIQFRPADEWSDRLVYEMASEIIFIASSRVPVVLNDRIDIALAVGADGVHVGAQDLPVAVARRLLGPGKLVGATARSADAARQALLDGADYVGVGPCYQSSTKPGLPTPLGPAGLAPVAEVATAIAIGGVTLERVPELLAAGAHGVAVIAAVADAPDPAAALATLLIAVASPHPRPAASAPAPAAAPDSPANPAALLQAVASPSPPALGSPSPSQSLIQIPGAVKDQDHPTAERIWINGLMPADPATSRDGGAAAWPGGGAAASPGGGAGHGGAAASDRGAEGVAG